MENRPRMERKERAKQFMPFAALKGHQEALKKKEKRIVPKLELTEDYAELLDRRLHQIQRNDIVTAIYFSQGEYRKITGMVSRIDETSRMLKIVNTKIAFQDLYEIEKEEEKTI